MRSKQNTWQQAARRHRGPKKQLRLLKRIFGPAATKAWKGHACSYCKPQKFKHPWPFLGEPFK